MRASKSLSMRGDTVSVPFRFVVNATTSVALSVSPNSSLSPRLAALADDFDEYRFTRLRFRLHRASDTSPSDFFCAGYLPGIVDTPPTTQAQMMEILNSVYLTGVETVPTPWSEVPKPVLAGMHPWYKTIPGTPEASEEFQGGLYGACTTSSVLRLEIEGVCQFRAAVAAGNTPLERALAARTREKKRIMSLLSGETAVAPTVPVSRK